VIRIGRVASNVIWALTGITAGSGLATTEMRLVMSRAVDRGTKLHPTVKPTVFVDDLAADMCGPMKRVAEELGAFVEGIANFIKGTGQALSKTKCVCTTTTKELGDMLETRWKDLQIKAVKRVKALGVGLGAGIRRNTNDLKRG